MKSRQASKRLKNGLFLVFFSVVSLAYLMPIGIVVINSFKRKAYINKYPFSLPTGRDFVGLKNYRAGVETIGFFEAFGWSLFITVGSVLLILLCTSMCAWYISRVKNRWTRAFYYLCVFSMVVPFQMVMYTLSKTADSLGLGNPLGITVVYLGFGAGLAVFLFAGFMRSVPLEIEEAAMIDGCSPPQTFFLIVLPILKPTMVSVGILETMWIWNDYLLPTLVLDQKKYKTIPMAIQYLKGGYGSIDWGLMMAMLVLAILPVILFYVSCQKYIITGVAAGAVKG